MEVAPAPGIDVRQSRLPSRALWDTALPLDKLAKKGLATLFMRTTIAGLERERPFDAVLLYNIPQIALAPALRSPIAVDVADDLLSMLAHEIPHWAAGAITTLAGHAWRALLKRANLVTAASSVLAESLPAKAVLVPNGADLEATSRANGQAWRDRYPGPIVGFVGAFEYFVDLTFILDLAARLSDCTFLLAGGGREHSRVAAEVVRRKLENVQLPGPIPHSAALDCIAAFDVALLPFKPGPVGDAASPLKLFEYIALRRPVVCTPSEEVRRLFGGCLHECMNAEEGARRIRELLADPNLGTDGIRDAYRQVEERFRWDRLSRQYEQLLLGIHNRPQ